MTDVRPSPQPAGLDDYVRQLVDGFPELTDDQRHRITTLLRPAAPLSPPTELRRPVVPEQRRAA